MDLLDRLRPRWRHSDPLVRAAAVREMGDGDAGRLATVAREDPDPRVRRAAIETLTDPALLEHLAEGDADPGLRSLAAERAREVLIAAAAADAPLAACEAALARLTDERSAGAVAIAAAHASIREAALARVASDRVLRDIVRQATDPATRQAALARIHDPSVLRSIAVADVPPEIAVDAVERLDDVDALRAVAGNRAASKAVRQRARALLPPDATAPEDVAAEPPVAGRAPEIPGVVDPREAAAHRARIALEEARAGRDALCARVASLEGPEALDELARAREAWEQLGPVPAAEAEGFARRFREAAEHCTARHRAWQIGEALHARLMPLVREAESLAGSLPPPRAARWRALEERWGAARGTGTPREDVGELDRRFASAKERVHLHRQQTEEQRAAHQQENLARLGALCVRLEALAGGDTLKLATARRELATADAALADPGPLPPAEARATVARLTEARDRLARRARQDEETEEWRRWANTGAQEQLIQRVETLLESNDLAEGVRVLGGLQEEWAQIATATPDKSRALWERFRTARNELRRRCDAWLAENLERKRALVAQVAGVGESTTWNDTTDLVRRLQAEWKAIGPVPGRHARALWQEFREPCDRFFARRKEHFARVDAVRGENAARKIALCERAEALADSTDWDATTPIMKSLQAEWKNVGPVPRPQDEALWKRFRGACDRFFDRRSRRDEVAHEEDLAKAAALCERLEGLAASVGSEGAPAADDLPKAIDDVWGEWLQLDLAPADDSRPLRDRLHAACTQIAAAQPEALRGTRLDLETTRARREKLCARLEKLAAPIAEAPRAATSLADMASALRDRLAANTIVKGRGTEAIRADTAQEVQRLCQSWEQLGPLLDDDARALAERFAAARARAAASRT